MSAAGVKVRYPSCYVLVTDLDESTANFYGTPGPSVKNSDQPVSGNSEGVLIFAKIYILRKLQTLLTTSAI